MRILITGGPSTGKTTLGAEFAAIARSTDEVRDLDWDEGSEAVCGWLFDAEGDFVIEGCIVPRALRKFLEESDEKPCDLIIWLSNPKKEQTDERAGTDVVIMITRAGGESEKRDEDMQV